MSAPIQFLVTAGPTHEPIDAVRYLANRSSGRMGIAIAAAAAARGHATTLLLGPVVAAPPADVRCHRFRTSSDLESLLAREAPAADVIVMAAAVADFRPVQPAGAGKIERGAGLTIQCEPVPDLIRGVASRRSRGQRLIGFALEEPQKLNTRAKWKLTTKDLDAVVANPLATMDADSITGRVYLRDGSVLTPPIDQHAEESDGTPVSLPKDSFAKWLVGVIESLPARDES